MLTSVRKRALGTDAGTRRVPLHARQLPPYTSRFHCALVQSMVETARGTEPSTVKDLLEHLASADHRPMHVAATEFEGVLDAIRANRFGRPAEKRMMQVHQRYLVHLSLHTLFLEGLPFVQILAKFLGYHFARQYPERERQRILHAIIEDLLNLEAVPAAERDAVSWQLWSVLLSLVGPEGVSAGVGPVRWANHRRLYCKPKKYWPPTRWPAHDRWSKDVLTDFLDANPTVIPDVMESCTRLRTIGWKRAVKETRLGRTEAIVPLYRETGLPVWNMPAYVNAPYSLLHSRDKYRSVDLVLKLGAYVITGFDPERLFCELPPVDHLATGWAKRVQQVGHLKTLSEHLGFAPFPEWWYDSDGRLRSCKRH